jgi:ferrous iron transport protein B
MPDCIIAVVDATNLERNLYLATQLLETGRPLVVALTMIDLAPKRGIEIDATRLSAALGVPVVPIIATQRQGLDALASAVLQAVSEAAPAALGWRLSEQAERELAALAANGNGSYSANKLEQQAKRYAALVDLYAEELPPEPQRQAAVKDARRRLAQGNARWWQEPLLARYEWIEGVARSSVVSGNAPRSSTTKRIDRFVTHKVFGPLILLAVMLIVFQTIFSWAQLPMDLIDHGFGQLSELVRGALPPGLLTDLLTDGVIAGVGGVLVFLPQILLLFFFISLLEDSGYMSRAAFLMDRLMRGVGLHGKAFMPLLSSFACAIPGIMATRTIENPKDRLATILIAPFMSCSARLPVYTLMIAAFFTEQKVLGVLSVGVLIILAMYLLGIAVAIVVAWILKHTILKSPPPPLVLELPPYRMPNPSTCSRRFARGRGCSCAARARSFSPSRFCSGRSRPFRVWKRRAARTTPSLPPLRRCAKPAPNREASRLRKSSLRRKNLIVPASRCDRAMPDARVASSNPSSRRSASIGRWASV